MQKYLFIDWPSTVCCFFNANNPTFLALMSVCAYIWMSEKSVAKEEKYCLIAENLPPLRCKLSDPAEKTIN